MAPRTSSLLAVNRVAFYLSRMSARGIPAEQVLAGTELRPQQVQGIFRGTPANYRTIIGNMLQLTGDPYLGIALGSEFRISDFGVLGYAVLSSATLRQSRSVMAKYYTLNEHIIRPEVTIDERRWCIGVSREGHVFKSVKVRPRLKGSGLVAWEAPWRVSKTVEPSDNIL